ncbi:hypothetical protein OIO90_001738 [Microbotryomycetes sp. JL221]|nr:hypothetical protein OIO90_001738 [Microbotryomycetes sp. JL221]
MDIYTTSFTLPRNAAIYDLAPIVATEEQQRHDDAPHITHANRTARSSLSSTAEHYAREGSAEPSSSNSTSIHGTASTAPSSHSDATSHADDKHTSQHAQPRARTASAEGVLSARTSSDLGDQMQRVCVDAMATNQCLVSFTPTDQQIHHQRGSTANASFDSAQKRAGSIAESITTSSTALSDRRFNIHVSGGYQQVMSARGHVLRENPLRRKLVVKVPRSEVLDSREKVKAEVRQKLDEVASTTKAHLAIVGQSSGAPGFGLETERSVEIVITGAFENTEQARVRLLVLLDELSGLHSEVCEIDYKLHNIISGRKRCVIQTIQEETATNIYFPTSFSGVLGPGQAMLLGRQNLIFITGEFFGVQRARDMLYQVSLHKSKCIISRDTAMLPRKLDWLLQDRLEDVRQIMVDNGTFINFPMIGSQASLISVYGDHRVNIERTIRAIMHIACQFYVASLWLLPISFDVFMPLPTINPAQIPSVLRQIATVSGAEVVFKSNCFEFHGLENEVRMAVQLALELDFVRQFHNEIRFQIELANEHRDFISGKKNGKLNKIMKSANVKVKFETFNDYNFLIDIAGTGSGALQGLTLLQEELPAEISFHVPEMYHKRIIGVGGRNIQRIMKSFGVYVKFSNAEEFAALGGYADNEDNVIARTPAKNAISLEHLKQSVMELVAPKDKEYVLETVSIPRRYHRTLLGEKSIFIHDIEAKTNSIVRFPNKELASDMVNIFGPESQVHIAAQMLLDHVPFEAELRLPHSEEMAALTLSAEWVSLIERVKHDLNITILPWVDRSGSGDDTILRFCLNRSNVDFLSPARDLVEEFLVKRDIHLYPGSLRPRSDSYADAFPFFNSKLLSTGFDVDRQDGRVDRNKLRMAASTPDIKAIFNDGSQGSHHSRYRNAVSGQVNARVQPGFPTIPFGQQPYGGAFGGTAYNHWGPPAPSYAQASASGASAAPSLNPVPGRYSLDGKTEPRSTLDPELTAESGEANPSTSDGQPSQDQSDVDAVADKLRAVPARQPRSFAGRTQSLDLSARITPRRIRGHQAHESVDHVQRTFNDLALN